MKYEAVNKEQLINRLGRQCSPMADRQGYVIGPVKSGDGYRMAHCSTHFTLADAQRYADELNDKYLPGTQAKTIEEESNE